MVVLGWFRRHPSRWTTFVTNRVSEVQRILPEAVWHHVDGASNPADCASRGLDPGELKTLKLWWRGPSWLSGASGEMAREGVMLEEADLPEARIKSHICDAMNKPSDSEFLLRFSSLSRLMRVSAWCLRWLRSRNVTVAHDSSRLDAVELQRSLLTWLRVVQTAHFSAEMNSIVLGKSLSRRHSLSKLIPFLDDQGLLRVEGRLRHFLLSYDEKHPVILPKDSHFTQLVVAACHARVLHGGVQQTLGFFRRRYWVPGGRSLVKGHIFRCVRCARWRTAVPQQIMADLPAARFRPSRPFLHTGIDYAGPIMVRTSKGRGHKATKAFVAVFICFSTRAVHVEHVVSDYTAEAFFSIFRRFVAWRGLPQAMYSDCGTNFAGAEAEFRRLFKAGSKEVSSIFSALAEEHVQWRFNPPAAPHFGGLWEAAVKSVKRHLRRVIDESTLTYEEMSTLLAGIEACLNSRPLSPLSDDPDDLSALTFSRRIRSPELSGALSLGRLGQSPLSLAGGLADARPVLEAVVE
ncbi:uncharacterized protein [Cardiocondyla obscurior]|uniref:uncharacterized protein n=1 Tax=Cardiocondyla obscurior TaxID=286306 RepID=UPI0039656D2C